jgi:hypothetical protein
MEILKSLVLFLKDNMSWIKDIFTMLFAAVATVISILAYRRARATVLQPIRSEVIKRQSSTIADILSAIPKSGGDISQRLDYYMIVWVNTFGLLSDYGYSYENQDHFEKEIFNKVYAAYVVGDLEKKDDKPISTVDIKKKNIEELEKGIIKIRSIRFTKKHQEYSNLLEDFASNPFLPSKISEILEQLNSNILTNLRVHLKSVLEKSFHEFTKNKAQKNLKKHFLP